MATQSGRLRSPRDEGHLIYADCTTKVTLKALPCNIYLALNYLPCGTDEICVNIPKRIAKGMVRSTRDVFVPKSPLEQPRCNVFKFASGGMHGNFQRVVLSTVVTLQGTVGVHEMVWADSPPVVYFERESKHFTANLPSSKEFVIRLKGTASDVASVEYGRVSSSQECPTGEWKGLKQYHVFAMVGASNETTRGFDFSATIGPLYPGDYYCFRFKVGRQSKLSNTKVSQISERVRKYLVTKAIGRSPECASAEMFFVGALEDATSELQTAYPTIRVKSDGGLEIPKEGDNSGAFHKQLSEKIAKKKVLEWFKPICDVKAKIEKMQTSFAALNKLSLLKRDVLKQVVAADEAQKIPTEQLLALDFVQNLFRNNPAKIVWPTTLPTDQKELIEVVLKMEKAPSEAQKWLTQLLSALEGVLSEFSDYDRFLAKMQALDSARSNFQAAFGETALQAYLKIVESQGKDLKDFFLTGLPPLAKADEVESIISTGLANLEIAFAETETTNIRAEIGADRFPLYVSLDVGAALVPFPSAKSAASLADFDMLQYVGVNLYFSPVDKNQSIRDSSWGKTLSVTGGIDLLGPTNARAAGAYVRLSTTLQQNIPDPFSTMLIDS